jgi:hypothetical protein
VLANFQAGGINLSAAVFYPAVAGATYTIGVSASSGCTWGAYSTASWVTIMSGQTGSGSGAVTVSVARNTTRSARTAQIVIGNRSLMISQGGIK